MINTPSMKLKQKLLATLLLIGASVLGRLIPHPWNMTPLIASAIFAGVHLGKRWAVIVPLVAMILSDVVIGFYDWRILLSVYLSMAIVGVLAYFSRMRKGTSTFIGRPIIASLFFFLTTNFAVWMFGTMYPHTLFGLAAAYIAGLPFLGYQLIGDILYTALFFGVYEYAVSLHPKKKEKAVHTVPASF